jgi:hypothetical protein
MEAKEEYTKLINDTSDIFIINKGIKIEAIFPQTKKKLKSTFKISTKTKSYYNYITFSLYLYFFSYFAKNFIK